MFRKKPGLSFGGVFMQRFHESVFVMQDHPAQSFPLLGNRREYDELESVAPECLRLAAAWAAQQIREAFPDDCAPGYLIRDRDEVYGERLRERVQEMGTTEVLTAVVTEGQSLASRIITDHNGVSRPILGYTETEESPLLRTRKCYAFPRNIRSLMRSPVQGRR